jgi:hypothetical protein
MSTPPAKRWKSAADDLLRTLWADKFSLTEISTKLCKAGFPYTRNAMAGRAARLGLMGGMSPAERRERKRLAAQRAPRRSRKAHAQDINVLNRLQTIRALPKPGAPRSVIAGTGYGKPVRLMGLRFGRCKWPIGDHDFLFCNDTAASPLLPYCGPHCRIAYWTP